MEKNIWYRRIPKVDVLLESKEIARLIEECSYDVVLEAVRKELEALRTFIGECQSEKEANERVEALKERIVRRAKRASRPNMRPVINATGTILHTNLGRAPIGEQHIRHIGKIALGYSNLEYNLEEGKRGERYAHFEELLCKITGAEAAMAVNNNAAAVLLVLNTMGKGGEVVVSRGELVEIGGKFRVPDVMEQSGATLVEVGTTNKTHLADYEEAVTEETKALLKVHTSNYRIVGFTESVSVMELAKIAKEKELPLIEEIGSGVLVDLSKYGLSYEPTVQESIKAGADIVCFSGDKLLGGPQAGIIVGRKKYIDMMKKNQLTRALRIDKFTASALEILLMEYLSEERALKNIPALRMITESFGDVEKRAKKLRNMLVRRNIKADVRLDKCESQVGGGSLPLERLDSMAVCMRPKNITTAQLEERMRHLPVPIIPRTVNDEIVLDMRTIAKEGMDEIVRELSGTGILEKNWEPGEYV